MKKHFLFLLLFLAGLASAQNTNDYHYTLEPVLTGEKAYFNISIRYESTGNESFFQLPRIWGSQPKPDFIRLDTIIGAVKVAQKDEYTLKLKHKNKKKVELRYRVYNAISDSIPGRGEEYVPAITGTYFSLFSNSVFFIPRSESGNYNFFIDWINYPAAYRQQPLTSFGPGLKQQLLRVWGKDLQNMVMVGGDYRLYRDQSARGKVTDFAIRGKWDFTDSAMFRFVASTMEQQHNFWNDHATESYLVTMSAATYGSEDEMSYTGTGLHNSFAVIALCNKRTQVESLAYLYHHELMHHWIGHRIENAANEELSYWFSEGFTDYFARRNMFESGLLTEREYLSVLDSVFALHYNHPLAESHNDSIRVHFWDDPFYGKLPYNRGSIFAYYLDCRIKAQTGNQKDLKSVMQQMLAELNGKNKPFTWDWLEAEVKKVSGIDIKKDIDEYLVSGQLIPFEAFTACKVPLVKKQVRMPGFGFTYEKLSDGKNWKVLTVDPESGAGKAGLLAGDLVVGYSLYGDAYSPSRVTVDREGKIQHLDFQAYVLSKPVPQHAE